MISLEFKFMTDCILVCGLSCFFQPVCCLFTDRFCGGKNTALLIEDIHQPIGFYIDVAITCVCKLGDVAQKVNSPVNYPTNGERLLYADLRKLSNKLPHKWRTATCPNFSIYLFSNRKKIVKNSKLFYSNSFVTFVSDYLGLAPVIPK